MLIIGLKTFIKKLGSTQFKQTCSHCHNQPTYTAIETGKQFRLFFIPIFTFGKKFRIECPICRYGYEIPKEELDSLIH